MATSTSTDSVAEHMRHLRMKMVQQKIQNEKEKLTRPPSVESNNGDLENQARLQQAMLRRQELLDKIRREQLLNEENKRPRTHSPNRRRYTPSPLPPPSRRSLPELVHYMNQNQNPNPYYNQMPDTHRSKPEIPKVKHVIEHKIAGPENKQQNPYQLPPIQQQAPPPVIVQPPPPPPIVSMQQPMQQPIIQAPAPQHIITGYPQPVIHNLGGQGQSGDNRQGGSMFNKSEMGDMMLMQNYQLHQMVMQKMMLNEIGGVGGGLGGRTHSSCSSHHHGHGHGHGCGCATCVPVMPVPAVPALPGGAIHHHHYSNPPSQPAVHHYSTMPAMDIRGGYPYRDYGSAYTAPGYGYAAYDGGNNYYAYH